jgi:glycosyltransferase involved in cell wall biosynthesis
MELSNLTSSYEWKRFSEGIDLLTIFPGRRTEGLRFHEVLRRMRHALMETRVQVCLLPSYAPQSSMAALLAAKSLGLATVMMNDSHAGTSRARGPVALLKRCLVRLFDSALVAGQPQKRYFESMGLQKEKIFIGYDAVDNDHFARQAARVRECGSEFRVHYGLPEHYFLSLGRFVEKKNLLTLVRAYKQFLDASQSKQTHLVLVGSGKEEHKLRALCSELALQVCDHSNNVSRQFVAPCVHFYGFRQIDENPIFYALAEAFVLPSLHEEWGLVVNEAMASGLPVVVSETAGCAEDLIEESFPTGLRPEHQVQIEGAGLKRRLRSNGFVFDPRSAAELSRVLLLLEKAGGLRQLMGVESQRIVGKFSCENFARNALKAVEVACGT